MLQLGQEIPPNKWTHIWWSSVGFLISLFYHYKNLSKLLRSSGTLTWWNIDSISAMKATCSSLNLVSTPTSWLVKSGPDVSRLLRDLPLNYALQSNTMETFPGFAGWTTPWCGTEHFFSGLPLSAFLTYLLQSYLIQFLKHFIKIFIF